MLIAFLKYQQNSILLDGLPSERATHAPLLSMHAFVVRSDNEKFYCL